MITDKQLHLLVLLAALAVGLFVGSRMVYKHVYDRGYSEAAANEERYKKSDREVKQQIDLENMRHEVREIAKWVEQQEKLNAVPPCTSQDLPPAQTDCCKGACRCNGPCGCVKKKGTCDCCPGCPGAGYKKNACCGCRGCECCGGCAAKGGGR